MMKFALLGLVAAMIATAPAVARPTSEKAVSIVLVHGAFADASGWQAVYNRLSAEGYEVLVVQNPTITLEGDVAATSQVIAKAKHPVILVGHSYCGAVITQAGVDPKVRSLVYLAAFAPDVGESVFELATAPIAGFEGPPLLAPSEGYILVDPMKFAADLPVSTTRFMAASQVPWGLGSVQAKITSTAWKEKPTYYMVAAQDHMIAPSGQRSMSARAKATTIEVQSSHAVMLSHPKKVADFIRRAANETQ